MFYSQVEINICKHILINYNGPQSYLYDSLSYEAVLT